MINFRLCWLAALAGGILFGSDFSLQAGTPKALVIMLDGTRADVVDAAATPNLHKLIAGQWQPGYHGAYADNARSLSDARPNSAPNHTAIATGVTAAKHFSHDLGYANRHWITVLEPGLSRHNGRYRLFLQSIDLWSACESRPFPLNEPRIGVSQEQPKPRRSYPIPFITCQGRFLHPPQTHPAPVTYFGGILHRFSMNALLARDLKTVFEI